MLLLLSYPSNCISAHDSRAGRGGKSSAASWLCCGELSALLSLSSANPLKCVCPTELVLARGTWASAPSKPGLQAKMICKKHQGEVFLPPPSHRNASCLWDDIWKKYKSVPHSGFARAAKSQPLPSFLQEITGAVPTAW